MGPSGAGKSTISNLLSTRFPIFCDDSVFVKPEDGQYYLYQNPNENKHVQIITKARFKLKKSFIIKQSSDNRIIPVSDLSEITGFFLKQFKFSKYDEKKQLANLFAFLETHPHLYTFHFSQDEERVIKTYASLINN
jgi:hypothetical protein